MLLARSILLIIETLFKLRSTKMGKEVLERMIVKQYSGCLRSEKMLQHFNHTFITALLDGAGMKECVSYIEECIHRQYDMLLTLRLLCLLSCTCSGLLSREYQTLKLQFLHSYGYQHMITFFNLKKVYIFFLNYRRLLNTLILDLDYLFAKWWRLRLSKTLKSGRKFSDYILQMSFFNVWSFANI